MIEDINRLVPCAASVGGQFLAKIKENHDAFQNEKTGPQESKAKKL